MPGKAERVASLPCWMRDTRLLVDNHFSGKLQGGAQNTCLQPN